MTIKNLIEEALNLAQVYGAEYADIRVDDLKHEFIEVENGKLENLYNSDSIGFGIRILLKGCWGFSASSILNKMEIEKVVKQAVNIAKASGMVKKENIVLADSTPLRVKYTSPFEIDPFKVPLSDKLNLLMNISQKASKYEEITVSKSELNFFKHNKIFASTEGAYIEQEYTKSGAGFQVWAMKDSEIQVRSYPASFGGDFRNEGYEFVTGLKLENHVERMCEEAIQLLTAEQCPAGEKTIVLEGSQLAIQIHESIGHPIEYDRVLGMEASFAGTSFLTEEKLNTLQYGSDIVNVYADATIPYGLGSFAYDDEGIEAQRVPIIKNGLFVGYITSRETAIKLGQKSMGAMKAENWNFIPLIRMTNINLEAGKWKFEDLIKDTEDGIYFSTNKSWSIDDRRWNFQFGTEIAWQIKNGELKKVYKNPTYTDNSVHFWNSCDAICNKDYWNIWGIPNCGKGEPMQTAHVGHGAAPARFKNIRVGVLE